MTALSAFQTFAAIVAATSALAAVRVFDRSSLRDAAVILFCSMAAACTYNASNGAPALAIVGLAGAATCGWSWHVSRTLFRNGASLGLPILAVIAAISAPFVLEVVLQMLGPGWRPAAAPLVRMASNLERLVSSAALTLMLLEAFRQYENQSDLERRFRRRFAALFGALIAASVVWLRGSPSSSFAGAAGDWARTTFMMVCCLAMLVALRHRARHRLPVDAERIANAETPRRAPAPNAEDLALAKRVEALASEVGVFTTPELKVADFAARLGEPAYKVTRAISQASSHANFNRLLNHHRIERARSMLSDEACADQSVLAIALDCGFGSVGPFNRAFKEIVGMTPREYRSAALSTAPHSPSAASPAAA